MSDRTTVSLVIYKATPRQLKKINESLTSEGLISEHAALGDIVYGDEVPLNAHDEIAGIVAGIAASSIFEVWVDPKYEYTGEKVIYAGANLGFFQVRSNSEGEDLFGRSEVLALLAMPKADRDLKLGLPWVNAIERAKASLPNA